MKKYKKIDEYVFWMCNDTIESDNYENTLNLNKNWNVHSKKIIFKKRLNTKYNR